MRNKIGKIASLSDGFGKVVAEDGAYIFLDCDIKDKDINVGTLVSFQGEEIRNEKRAFFIRKYTLNNNDLASNKVYIKKD